MNHPIKLRNAALIVALTAIGATAAAQFLPYYVAPEDGFVEQDSMPAPAEPAPAQPILVEPGETLTPGETLVAPQATPAPAEDRSIAQPPITVEDRRMTLDQRIQSNVMDVLANAPNISGKIGVGSEDAVVTLTGYTATAGQAYRAGRYAGSVEGVKEVRNEIRGRVGGSY